MNLNKYDSQGFPYTAEESLARAEALFVPNYVHHGYHADSVRHVAQDKLLPYSIGRNAGKRAAKARRAELLGSIRK